MSSCFWITFKDERFERILAVNVIDMAFLPINKFHITCGASIHTTPLLYHRINTKTTISGQKKRFTGDNTLILIYIFVKHFLRRLGKRIEKRGHNFAKIERSFGIILPQTVI